MTRLTDLSTKIDFLANKVTDLETAINGDNIKATITGAAIAIAAPLLLETFKWLKENINKKKREKEEREEIIKFLKADISSILTSIGASTINYRLIKKDIPLSPTLIASNLFLKNKLNKIFFINNHEEIFEIYAKYFILKGGFEATLNPKITSGQKLIIIRSCTFIVKKILNLDIKYIREETLNYVLDTYERLDRQTKKDADIIELFHELKKLKRKFSKES